MPNPGDVILVQSYLDESGEHVGQHPFIVLDNKPGSIDDLKFDLVAVACSSYKDNNDKTFRGLKDKSIVNVYAADGLKKDSFVKCSPLVYFNNTINYRVIGDITDRAWRSIVQTITYLDDMEEIEDNLNNL